VRKMEIDDKAFEWFVSNDTGCSSKTIWAVMTGIEIPNDWIGHPWDPADLGRCIRLLEKFPEWVPRLHEVSEKYLVWKPLIDNWDELVDLYRQEAPTGKAPKLYKRMNDLLR